MNPSTSTEDRDDSLPGASSSSSHVVSGEDSKVGNLEESLISFLTAVELQVFKTFVKNFLANPDLQRDDATALDYVFGPIIREVLQLIEDEEVIIHQNLSLKMVVVQVHGNTPANCYWFPPGHSMCRCRAFTYGNKPYCKHILAAHLFLALTPKEKYKPISNERFESVMDDLTEP